MSLRVDELFNMNNLREKNSRLDQESTPGLLVQARIFSLKLLIYDLPDGYSES